MFAIAVQTTCNVECVQLDRCRTSGQPGSSQALVKCACGANKLSTDTASILTSHNRSTTLLVEALFFSTTRWIIFLVCPPTMKVTILVHQGSNVCGVSGNLHLTKLLTNLLKPIQQGFTSFSSVLNPTAFARVQIEASNMVHRAKCWSQSDH